MFTLVLVPFAVVTVIGPVVAAAGTVASNCVGEDAPDVVVSTAPLNLTVSGPKKFLPFMMTLDPRGPKPGEKSVTNGAEPGTKKLLDVVKEPKEFDMLIKPDVAPAGTVV